MRNFHFVNNFATALAADILAADTTFALAASPPDVPTLTAGSTLALTLFTVDETTGEETAREVIYVTATDPSTQTLSTVERAAEGTTALGWTAADTKVEARITQGMLAGMIQKNYGEFLYAGHDNAWTDNNWNSLTYENLLPLLDNSVFIMSNSGGDEINPVDGPINGIGIGNRISVGRNSIVLGVSPSTWVGATGLSNVCIGATAYVYGNENVAVGDQAQATDAEGVAVGVNSNVTGTGGVAVGRRARANRKGAVAVGWWSEVGDFNGVAIGAEAKTTESEQVVLGPYHRVSNVPGGFVLNAIPHLTTNDEYAPTYISGPNTPASVRANAAKIVVQTPSIDLSVQDAIAAIAMPANSVLFIDSIDFVPTFASAPTGTPAFSVGTGAAAPADILAATPLASNAVHERTMVSVDRPAGVTALEAKVTTPVTGGSLSGRLVVHGYVMEV